MCVSNWHSSVRHTLSNTRVCLTKNWLQLQFCLYYIDMAPPRWDSGPVSCLDDATIFCHSVALYTIFRDISWCGVDPSLVNRVARGVAHVWQRLTWWKNFLQFGLTGTDWFYLWLLRFPDIIPFDFLLWGFVLKRIQLTKGGMSLNFRENGHKLTSDI